MTITNFGLLGEGWNNPDQPSCRYKQYADIDREEVEHFSYAGLWIGGIVKGNSRVTTAIVDGVFDYGAEGFEFSYSPDPADTIRIKSSIETSKYYSPRAISHQDFICDYNDFGGVINHDPMGIRVHQESYAWNYSFTDAFVIMDYTIYNESYKIDPQGKGWNIKNIYLGMWADASVANMNYTSAYEPGGGFTWYDNLDGFDHSIFDPDPSDQTPGYPRHIAYQYDADGDNGFAHSYIGFRILGNAAVPRDYWTTYYRQWVWSTSVNMNYLEYAMPVDDEQRYNWMHKSVPRKIGVEGYNSNGYPNDPDSWIFLISGGPFGSRPDPATPDSANWIMEPGDSIKVALAVTCARWATSALSDNEARKAYLYANSDWAQIAFNGEDVNSNGILEPEEDVDQDGVLDRYILPAPPPSPRLHIVAESKQATLYWTRHPEESKDPLTQKKDFEGYRIYARSKTVTDNPKWTLLGQFDQKNEIGYNTGFEHIKIPREEATVTQVNGMDTTYAYQIFNSDTSYYKIIDRDTVFYRFVNQGIKSGWPERNVYAVTSYDKGDPTTGLESLESNIITNLTYVIAGKRPQSETAQKNTQVGVYPNPYKARAVWDGFGERERMIWFYNLPSRAQIKIFTLSGELVDSFKHNAHSYQGTDINNLKSVSARGNIEFSGGEHAWDLITKWDQAVATGLYIFTVENLENGKIQRGKFLIIK